MTKTITASCSFFLFLTLFVSCAKENISTPDPCSGKSITVDGTVTPTSGGTSSNGAINITATGSSGFTYSLNNAAFVPGQSFSNLAAGSYTITAKDASGCTGSKSFVVTASTCPTITITATTTIASSPTTADGQITATASGSTGITYSLNNGAFQATGTFTNLVAGSYVVNAKDVNGCTASNTFLITSASCPSITVTTVIVPTAGPTATNGSITASAAGGVSPYSYSKNAGVSYQSSGSFTNLLAGTYTIIVKDANGCQGSSGTITVASAVCPAITVVNQIAGSDKCLNNTGSITVTATGSTGFLYSMNNGVFQASNFFNTLPAGNYTIAVQDLNGCTNTSSVNVPEAPAGPKFTAVKAMMANNCAIPGCHTGPSPQNGLNFTDDCTIVAQSARIKARAVDANPSVMPPTGALPASEKQKIIDWVNSGASHSN